MKKAPALATAVLAAFMSLPPQNIHAQDVPVGKMKTHPYAQRPILRIYTQPDEAAEAQARKHSMRHRVLCIAVMRPLFDDNSVTDEDMKAKIDSFFTAKNLPIRVFLKRYPSSEPSFTVFSEGKSAWGGRMDLKTFLGKLPDIEKNARDPSAIGRHFTALNMPYVPEY